MAEIAVLLILFVLYGLNIYLDVKAYKANNNCSHNCNQGRSCNCR